jgi:hypothetical protein
MAIITCLKLVLTIFNIFSIYFWLVFLASGFSFVTLSLIFITSDFVTLVYIFSLLNEHILAPSSVSMDYRSVVRCIEF